MGRVEEWGERSPPTNVVWIRFQLAAKCGLNFFLILTLVIGFSEGNFHLSFCLEFEVS